jgi:hypothetical protein
MNGLVTDTSAGSLKQTTDYTDERSKQGEGAQLGQPPEAYVMKRLFRGETVIRRLESRWRELWAHFDGDQYVERSTTDNGLVRVETREGGKKPRWRSRLVRNRFTKAIVGEVSVVASRVPQWEVTPPNGDVEMRNKARLGEKVLIALHQKLRIRQVTFDTCQVAAVTGDGYAFPYWDPTIGLPVMEDVPLTQPGTDTPEAPAMQKVRNGRAAAPPPDSLAHAIGPQDMAAQGADTGQDLTIEPAQPAPTARQWTGKRTGDIRIKVLRQDQVMWHPNQSFEESRWHAVRDAQPCEDVHERLHAELGTCKGDHCLCHEIKPDASAAALDYQDGDSTADLVFVYHYFERPSNAFARGRYLLIAGRHIISKVYPYPIQADMPVIHRMPWIRRTNRDRGLGIGELAIDIQRSINRIVNQLIAWRYLCLNPQLLAPEGSIKSVVTEEPGVVVEYRPTGGKEPKWRDVPEIPVSLFKDLEQAYQDMDMVVGGSSALPPGVESGSGIQAVNEREQSFRAQVIANLATWYSGLGRHLLCLVKQHYTEERLLTINGRFGVEMIEDFMGDQLGGPDEEFADVRVAEASITPRTRAEMEAKIMMFADKGWIPPQMAMGALQGGTAEVILDRFELDIAKAHRHINQLILIGRGKVDESLVPEPGPMDNHDVQADVLMEWMKTADFERQHEIVQVLAMALLNGHQAMQQAKLDQEAMRVATRAAQQGMDNAGADQGGPSGAPGQDVSRPSIATNAEALSGAGG